MGNKGVEFIPQVHKDRIHTIVGRVEELSSKGYKVTVCRLSDYKIEIDPNEPKVKVSDFLITYWS